MSEGVNPPSKASDGDFLGRFREVIGDPLNLLIERNPRAGTVEGTDVYLHNGNRVPVAGPGAYYGAFSQLLIVNRGVHEPLEEYVFQEMIKKLPAAPNMIEVGAYWAHYSMWLKRTRPQATTIMVEPDSNFLAVGRANFVRNKFDGEFIQAKVAKGEWELDAFLRSRNITHLNVLHSDIQGFEMQLLEGARTSLENSLVDYVFISTHSQPLHNGVTSELARLGYRVEVSSDFDNDTTSYDGLVFASSIQAEQIFREFKHFGRTNIVSACADNLVQAILQAREGTL